MAMASFMGIGAFAAPLTPDAALQRAQKESPARIRGGERSMSLAKTAVSKNTENLYYIFNQGTNRGFVIVSADDRLPALLGYSDKGTFSESNAPENFKWWISEYARQIEWYLTEGYKLENIPGNGEKVSKAPLYSKPERESRTAIPPLLPTTWDQGDPYNLNCPEIGGERTVTGCVATSQAQVMRYHKWPEGPGTGSHSYTWNSKTLSYDFSANTFDWENMLDAYGNVSATTAQKNAIANLMYACGVSVNMSYNVSSAGGSGAYSLLQPYALKEYFGYDSKASFIMREYMSAAKWSDAIYHELQQKRPVLYSGSGTNGGHSFVCDGYQGDEYFHFNWGWEGSSDGYFLLDALNPGSLGIGGGAGGFNSNQGITIGIGKPGTVDIEEIYPIFFYTGLAMEVSDGSGTEYNIKVSDDGNAIFNWSGYEYTGQLGICIRKDSDVPTYSGNEDSTTFSPIASNGNVSGFRWYYCPVSTSGLEAGTYILTPAFKPENGEWKELLINTSGTQFYEMTVESDGSIILNKGVVKPMLEISSLSSATDIYSCSDTKFYFDYTNREAPFEGEIMMYAREEDGQEANLITTLTLSLALDTSGRHGFTATVNLAPGTYEFYFTKANGDVISGYYTKDVIRDPSKIYPSATNLRAVNLTDGVELSWDAPEITPVAPTAMTEDFESGDAFADNFGNWIFVDKDNSAIGGFDNLTVPGITFGTTKGSFWVWDTDAAGNASFNAHSGSKYLFSLFRWDDGQSDDWAISPELCGEAQTISFYAKSYHSNYLETLEVYYSMGSTNPDDFIKIDVSGLDEIPNSWELYTASLPEGARRFALRYCSTGRFMVQVDDVTYIPAPLKLPTHIGYDVYRDGEPINESMIAGQTHLDTNVAHGQTYNYKVVAKYEEGDGEPSEELLHTYELPTGLKALGIDIDQEYEIFSLDGIRIQKDLKAIAPGTYIVRQGNKSLKIVVK